MSSRTPPPGLRPGNLHDEELLSNVRPAEWANPTPAPRYDLVVIGAGTAGLVTAAGAAGLGARVALIERQLMGGDCLNSGCVPSKALLRSAAAQFEGHLLFLHGIHARETADGGVQFHHAGSILAGVEVRLNFHFQSEQAFAEMVEAFGGHFFW